MLLALLLTLCAAALLVGIEAASLTHARAQAALTADDRAADVLLSGVHGVERDAQTAFRWTTADARIRVFARGSGPQMLSIALGAPPPLPTTQTFTLALANHAPIVLSLDSHPRHYRLLVPEESVQFDRVELGLQSSVVIVPPDTRAVGLRLAAVSLRSLAPGMIVPAPTHLAAQLLLLGLCAALLLRLRTPLWLLAASLVALIAGLATLSAQQPLIATAYVQRLCGWFALLVVLTLLLLPVAERRLNWIGGQASIRAVWGITILACVIRLLGALFSAFDLDLNADRFVKALTGTLVVTRRSFEFRNGITIYPPGPYLAFLPALLLGLKPATVVQVGVALADGIAALPTALLARKLGASKRAMLFVALLYAALPINLTMLWWGLSAQVFGQGLMAPLALALLAAFERSTARLWWLAGALLTTALLSHIGVAILAVAWLGLAWLILRFRPRITRAVWWRFTALLALSGLAAVVLIYVNVVALKIEQAQVIGEKVIARDYVPAYNLILRGFQIAFHELGFVLLLPGLLLMQQRRMPGGASALVGGWLLAVAVFWAIEMFSGLQVRYIVFLAPLACLGIATVLDRIATRGRAARFLGWAAVLLLTTQSSVVWLSSVFEHTQMSMVSLLR